MVGIPSFLTSWTPKVLRPLGDFVQKHPMGVAAIPLAFIALKLLARQGWIDGGSTKNVLNDDNEVKTVDWAHISLRLPQRGFTTIKYLTKLGTKTAVVSLVLLGATAATWRFYKPVV